MENDEVSYMVSRLAQNIATMEESGSYWPEEFTAFKSFPGDLYRLTIFRPSLSNENLITK